MGGVCSQHGGVARHRDLYPRHRRIARRLNIGHNDKMLACRIKQGQASLRNMQRPRQFAHGGLHHSIQFQWLIDRGRDLREHGQTVLDTIMRSRGNRNASHRGQAESNCCTFARAAVNPDMLLVGFDCQFAEREPQAAAMFLLPTRHKLLE